MRNLLNLAMAILFILAIALQLTGNLPHEIIGTALFVLLAIHNLINVKWHKSIAKGRYGFRRIFNLIVNSLLFACFSVVIASGVLISDNLYPFIQAQDGFFVRRIHTAFSYYLLLLVSVHIGLHSAVLLPRLRWRKRGKRIDILSKAIALIISLYGIKAFFDMDMFLKLTGSFSFSYWDFENNAILFFANYLSIMALFAFLAHYAVKLARRFRVKREG